jgi:hypothetical protein
MLILACCAAAISLGVAALSFFKDSLIPSNRNTTAAPSGSTPSTAPSASTTPKGSLPEILIGKPSPTPEELVPLATSRKIVSNTLELGRRQFRPYRFVVEENLQNPRITGKLSVQGGRDNDAELIVVDDQGLQDFSNRSRRFPNQYRVMVSNSVNVLIPIRRPGTYYVIISNRHALFYTKSIKADLALEYE